MPIGEDPAAHGHWCAFTDLYHTIPYQLHHTTPYLLPSPTSDNNSTLFGDATLVQGSFGTWYILPSTSMVDSVTGLRYAECSRAPDYITNGYGSPMQTTSCTWP